MEYVFSYTMHVGSHDVDGTAVLVEAGRDRDGFIPFKVEAITFDRHVSADRPSLASFKLESAMREWVRAQIEADEDVQAAWDEKVGNKAADYSAPYRTVYARNGAVA